MGEITAFIRENKPNNTKFHLHYTYKLYSAPDGYKITKIVIDNDPTAGFVSEFKARQRNFGENYETVISGPLKKYEWVGDTGSKQDHLDGCFVVPYLKSIKITIEKM